MMELFITCNNIVATLSRLPLTRQRVQNENMAWLSPVDPPPPPYYMQ